MTARSAPERRVAVVTGATGGMGRVIALELARSGMHVITVARDPRRAASLRDQIDREVGTGRLDVVPGDLSRRDGVIDAAAAVLARHSAVHVLVNNAGAHFSEHQLSPDGVERHIAVDYLAAYGLTLHLREALERGRARVVNVVSDALRDTRQVKLLGRPRPATVSTDGLDDLGQLNPADGFVPFQAYARAKLLTVMAGYDLARTLQDHGVTVNAVHPGIAATNIIDDLVPPALRPFRGLIRRYMLTPEEGASAALRLATDPALAGVTSRYFLRDVDTRTPPVSYDAIAQRQLRATSDRYFLPGRPR
ncbi:NAD(P)-dependent dehydrogenase, short-chain alcohol dehydrogenase family [Promicromonospora umidemergens]|uniref:SDR family oxidoreductase n=1 Tax=Promicromonospora umidemergens TaxID=629679 RepID=A0ABP8XKU1_9MICO|nr:SDR family NAD(P)-dependent oxidoreductase [Promicromonospora umidemergens]MCP2285679.1 NAD(P)-dependent dehydrogenase, short-chain alcohol dehydrogenase family [Promicromonospora umidemergens]